MGYDLKPGDVVDDRRDGKDQKAIIRSNDDHIKYYKYRDEQIAQQLDAGHPDHRITFFILEKTGNMKFYRDEGGAKIEWKTLQSGRWPHVKYWLSSDVDASPEAFLAFLVEARQLGWNMTPKDYHGLIHNAHLAARAVDNFFQSWPEMKPVIEAIQPEQPK